MTARKPNTQKSKLIKISVTPQVLDYLQRLVGYGLYGKTPTEVANTLVSRAIESFIERGHLEPVHQGKKYNADQP